MTLSKEEKRQVVGISAVVAFVLFLVLAIFLSAGGCKKEGAVPTGVEAEIPSFVSHGNEIGVVPFSDSVIAFTPNTKAFQFASAYSIGPVNATYPSTRMMYLDQADTVYNNVNGRNVFAKYCKDNKFDEVHFYHYSNIVQSSSNFPNFAAFNTTLANNGVTKRYPVLGSSSLTGFKNYRAYTTTSSQDQNGINYEREWWNNVTTLSNWLNEFNTINVYCDTKSPDLTCSFYMGWWNNLGGITDSAAARQILQVMDEVDLHVYQDNKITYSYTRSRLEVWAKAAESLGKIVYVNPIISTEQTAWGAGNNFQGNLLKAKGYAGIEKLYIDDYNLNASTKVKTWIRIKKFKYFTKRYCYKAILPQ